LGAEGAAAAGLARYEAARHGRTELVHAKSVEQGQHTQAHDPDAYDASAAPASDPAILAYDPVTPPI
jgi:salicylate hydroxylase